MDNYFIGDIVRYRTFWWGVQFLAENDEELDALTTIRDRCTLPESHYESGGIELWFMPDFCENKYKQPDGGFSLREINENAGLLEIRR